MSFIVNPATIPAVDRLRFNLFADDVGLEFDNLMNRLSDRLTWRGEVCGGKKTTFKDYKHPILFEITAEEDGFVYASTEILITRGNAYSYSFVGGRGWRACSDCREHYVVQGATSAGFHSSYSQLECKEIGPKKIYNALQALTSHTKSAWKKAFRYLCFVFIESVRLIDFGNFVRHTLVKAAEKGLIQFYVLPTPEKLRRLPHCWGHASDAMRTFFLSHPPRTNWTIAAEALSVFRLSIKGQASNAAVIQQARQENIQQEEQRIQDEVNLCLSNVRVVMHS